VSFVESSDADRPVSMSDFFADLRWRGLVYQTTSESLGDWLKAGRRTLYAGFDPTSDSLHVGSLLPLLMLRRFQKAGHRPIAVVGGATGMIGDPSGKSDERQLLSAESLRANVEGLRRQMRQFLDFDGDAALLVDNADWLGRMSTIEFLRDVGKNFPVNVMLAKDSIKGRLDRQDAGISYTEFSYMLLQAYDFVHLHRTYGCQLQIGGSDQWGNITAGIDLARRMDSVQLFGMTSPLLLKSDGSKMGKTESGAIWLSADRTSPYAFYQYWINVEDADAGRTLRFLTDLPREQIESLDQARQTNPAARDSQRELARNLTRLVHGEAGLAKAEAATAIFFGSEIRDLSDADLGQVFADVPSHRLGRSLLDGDGLPLVDAMVLSTLAKSKAEARRTIEQGGAYVNNRRIDAGDYRLTARDLAGESMIVLRSGKKKYALLRFAAE
jgi:tyrosyl-tRNA synthetase